MFKVDLKSAFRLIPVRPEDRPLLGCFWQSKYYVDLRLPFGLRSAPALFNQLADALQFILSANYGIADLAHYLDDFFGVGPPSASPSRSLAAIHMKTILAVFPTDFEIVWTFMHVQRSVIESLAVLQLLQVSLG